jgi:hypothetical protein
MSVDNLIFRCSAVGELMGKTGLGLTGQKRAIYSYIEQFEGRTKEIKSKYLEKGIANELGAIELVNEVLGTNYQKNEDRLTNDFLTGECDIVGEDEIPDIKCSWDRFTFSEAKTSAKTNYEWQCRGYMELWDKPKSSIIFCLTDMPDSMILKQLESASYNFGGDLPDFIAIRMVVNCIFDIDNFHRFMEMAPIDRDKVQKQINNFVHIPKKNRVFQFKYERDNSKTELMYSRVKDARNFLKTIFNES